MCVNGSRSITCVYITYPLSVSCMNVLGLMAADQVVALWSIISHPVTCLQFNSALFFLLHHHDCICGEKTIP